MKAAFYAGATGLLAHQTAIDAIGNNLANLTTVGYKTEETSFRSLLYNDMYANTDTNPLTGYGVRAVGTGVNFTDGQLQPTAGALDFAVTGNALFAVMSGNQIAYTRDGQFGISAEGGTAYLVNANGAYVLDQNLQKIQVPYTASQTVDTQAVKEKLGLFSFRNPSALLPTEGNTFTPNEQSGAAQAVADAGKKILSGCLELSGTSTLDEMTNMIRAQRSYQMCAKVLQTADEDEQTINNLRK